MEVSDLTDEQIANLTHEQIEAIESDPDSLAQIMEGQVTATDESEDEPEQAEEESAANGAGEEEEEEEKPVVLNKSGKGIIPYEKFQGLRVENATLKEQLQDLQKARSELENLKAQKAAATTPERRAAIQKQLVERIGVMKEDFPQIADPLDSINEMITDLADELAAEKAANKEKAEAEATAKQEEINERVNEAKDNNPHLSFWEHNDKPAWNEALEQDQILLRQPKWRNKPYEERFVEVVKRVKAVMPEATEPPKPASAPDEPEKVAAKAKEKLAKAVVKKPTTLSDIQGGEKPLSEQEQAANMSGLELTKKLLSMPDHKARAMRAEFD